MSDMTLNEGEDRNFRNQFSEFLQRNVALKMYLLSKRKLLENEKEN